jgi:hypothetical protein
MNLRICYFDVKCAGGVVRLLSAAVVISGDGCAFT